jgi:hypothetical protein
MKNVEESSCPRSVDLLEKMKKHEEAVQLLGKGHFSLAPALTSGTCFF